MTATQRARVAGSRRRPGVRATVATSRPAPLDHRSSSAWRSCASLLPLIVAAAAVQQLQRPDRLDRRVHQRRRLRAARARPEHRGRPGRPARPRLRGVLRHRRLHRTPSPRRPSRATTSPSGRCSSSAPSWPPSFGILLGAPTLRLRGDYLAIVTLGFGEIVPIVFLNSSKYTDGTNGIGGISLARPLFDFTFPTAGNPWPFYLTMVAIITVVDDPHLPAPGLAPGPGLDGHPRGRAGGRGQRRQHGHDQAAGLRPRRLDGRPGRRLPAPPS